VAALGGVMRDGSLHLDAGKNGDDAYVAVASRFGVASRTLALAAPPDPSRGFIAVASYDDGVVIHDLHGFALRGVLGTGGSPSDVALARATLATTDTQGDAITLATLAPWAVQRIAGVPSGDEIEADPLDGAYYVTNRDEFGGALSRITRSGSVSRVATGDTAEGLAIDAKRGIVYVADVNADAVTAVDAKTMRVLRRFHVVARAFSLALSADGSKLYVVSNQSLGSPFAAPGSVVAVALGRTPRVAARSAPLDFPVGIAIEPARERLFVTDERDDAVDVLDARSLRAVHAPLPTCRTPWKPFFDSVDKRLYVPCAQGDAVDVYDTRSMRRVAGAPFATGGYPLAVTVWHPH
jgi:DNA-binding beta-propeller fold protein YncE